MKGSLKSQIKRYYLGSVLFLFTVFSLIYFLTIYILVSQVNIQLSNQILDQVSSNLSPILKTKDDYAVQQALRHIVSTSQVMGILIQTDDGNEIEYISSKVNASSLSLSVFSEVITFEGQYLIYDNSSEGYLIRVFFDNSKVYRLFILSCIIVFCILGAILIFAILFSQTLSRLSTSPLESMEKIVEDIGADLTSCNIDDSSSNYIEIGKVFVALKAMQIKIIEQIKVISRIEKDAIFYDLATKVAHDIRSPLSALNIVCQTNKVQDPVAKQLILDSTKRIEAIADDLLESRRVKRAKRVSSESLTRVEVEYLLEKIIREKSLMFSFDYTIDVASDEFALHISEIDFSRLMSNILQNSLEASSRNINVTLSTTQNEVQIKIADNGVGIPPTVLSQLGKCEISYGKQNGFGIGIFSGSNFVKSIGGRIEIDSVLNVGTQFSLFLPGRLGKLEVGPVV